MITLNLNSLNKLSGMVKELNIIPAEEDVDIDIHTFFKGNIQYVEVEPVYAGESEDYIIKNCPICGEESFLYIRYKETGNQEVSFDNAEKVVWKSCRHLSDVIMMEDGLFFLGFNKDNGWLT